VGKDLAGSPGCRPMGRDPLARRLRGTGCVPAPGGHLQHGVRPLRRTPAGQPERINHVGPTLLAHGTDEQKARWLPRILDAAEIWCQLFSEPGSGSDLASLTTRAVPVDGGWVLQGQKVWTSYAQFARWGIALVRTDPDAPKHRGLSYLVVDMTAPGIEIRPLVTLTGESSSTRCSSTTPSCVGLSGRRSEPGLVGGQHHPGPRAGDVLPVQGAGGPRGVPRTALRLAAAEGALDDPDVADALAEAAVKLRVFRLHNWRTLSRLTKGTEPGPESSVVKLSWTDMTQTMADAALLVVGPASPLWGDATHNPMAGKWQRQWLWSKAATIAGGTSEIQKTIIGDRILGLPR